MNREIKFRGFSEQLNKWLYGSFVTGLFENNKTKEDCPIIIDATLYPDYSCLADFDDMDCDVVASSVGQLTGLKDKNGVDVYEGDVIRGYAIMQPDYEIKAKVLLDEKRGQWMAEEIHPVYHEREPLFETLRDSRHKTEVIGNIYEHPHLLK